MIRDPTPFASGSLYRIAHSDCRRAKNPSVRLVQLAEANGLPSLRTGARRQDRALSGRELGILPLHDTALIEMTSGRIIPLLSFSTLCCLIL